MAVIKLSLQSQLMARNMTVRLFFPHDADKCKETKGVITLLHGFRGCESDWHMMSACSRFAAENGYIIIAPAADNSFYTDMALGAPFYSWITGEMREDLQRIFCLPTAKEENFIAGLSMGGYGALRIGLSRPDLFAACGSFSGSLDMRIMAMVGRMPLLPESIRGWVHATLSPVLGEELRLPHDADLFHLANDIAALPKAQQPRIMCIWGNQDAGLYQIVRQNQRFRKGTLPLNLDITFLQWDGVHEWKMWDRSLATFMSFIQNDNFIDKEKQRWLAPATTESSNN